MSMTSSFFLKAEKGGEWFRGKTEYDSVHLNPINRRVTMARRVRLSLIFLDRNNDDSLTSTKSQSKGKNVLPNKEIIWISRNFENPKMDFELFCNETVT